MAAVPAKGVASQKPDWCYISLGTWALMGIESPEPVINDTVLKLNFTNEGGVNRTSRVLKNITGMWLLQECRRIWNLAGKNLDWEDMNKMAAAAKPHVSFINPDAAEFAAPTNMPEVICDYCKSTAQTVPADEGAILRCVLDSLAMRFRQVLAMCEEISGQRIKTIHIVGGGTQNRQLCQLAADACGRRVLAGPIEATAIGNLMVQAVADGDVADLAQAREVIARSFEMDEYHPKDTAAWDDAYERFERVSP